MIEGLLAVDKPAGWSSFDVVKYVRSKVAASENSSPKAVKVGHSGTLDPFATGLLLVLIGRRYTAQAEQFLVLAKTYRAEIEIGSVSTTGDPEGEISPLSVRRPTKDELETVVQTFKGEIWQRPPAYSAIKVNGVRAYQLARRGEDFKLEERKVRVNSIRLLKYHYPEAQIEVSVSSGTYIRALVEDIGAKLGTGAYTKELRRIAIGSYSVAQAKAPDQINEQNVERLVENITADELKVE